MYGAELRIDVRNDSFYARFSDANGVRFWMDGKANDTAALQHVLAPDVHGKPKFRTVTLHSDATPDSLTWYRLIRIVNQYIEQTNQKER